MNKLSSFPTVRGLRTALDNSISADDCEAPSENRSAPMGKVDDPPINERALVRSARQGDLQAFNHLVLAYQDRAYTQACYLLGDPVVAEDIVQEAFVTIYKVLPTYRGGSFQSWLFRIVTNKCLDELRRQKRHPSTSFEPIDEWGEEVETPYWSVDRADTPEQCLIRAEVDRYLQGCLDRLRAEYRTAIVLVDVCDMRYGEAARIIGCPLGTFKSRLARARLQMQHFFREDSYITSR
jgi:RNA polymerase sigma factor (sigma-70 family)